MPMRAPSTSSAAVDADRLVVLDDLVVLRHVRIEVVLPVEHRALGHVQCNASPTRSANSTACSLSTGSDPGSPRHTGQTLRVRLGAELVRAPAEQLRRRGQLDVHLEADHRFLRLHPSWSLMPMTAARTCPTPPRPEASFTRSKRYARVRNGVRSRMCTRASVACRCCSCTATPRPSASGGATSSRSLTAGFEVIAPDLRGYGDSDLAPDGFYDVAAYSPRPATRSSTTCSGTNAARSWAATSAASIALRPLAALPRVRANASASSTPSPILRDERLRGRRHPARRRPRRPAPPPTTSCRQATDPDGARSPSSTRRPAAAPWVAGMYGHRLWARAGRVQPPTTSTFMTEPFGDADQLPRQLGRYETANGNRPMEDMPQAFEPARSPRSCSTGPRTTSCPPSFPDRCAVAFTECVGPFVVPDAGHFLQWEAGRRASTGRSRPSPLTQTAGAHGAAPRSRGAARNMTGSPSAGASTCTPIGNPSPSAPNGTLAAGVAGQVRRIVHTSDRYIDSGSAVFAPIRCRCTCRTCAPCRRAWPATRRPALGADADGLQIGVQVLAPALGEPVMFRLRARSRRPRRERRGRVSGRKLSERRLGTSACSHWRKWPASARRIR